ncbi:hypothetical protein J0S82_018924, partial [Galemys pyrenaicus]
STLRFSSIIRSANPISELADLVSGRSGPRCKKITYPIALVTFGTSICLPGLQSLLMDNRQPHSEDITVYNT